MLQDHPMYAYLPASDVARARRFYGQVLGFKPEEILGGSRHLHLRERHRLFPVSHSERGHLQGQPGVLAGRRH